MPAAPDRHRLLLLRHAKAVAGTGPQDEAADHARDLSERGLADAAALGEAMRRLAPDLVLVSSARRARRTLERLGPLGNPGPAVSVLDRLYLADAAELLGTLRAVDEAVGVLLLVGHNPGLHELALHLAAGGAPAALRAGMPTCTLVSIDVEGPWRDLRPGGTCQAGIIPP